MLLCKCIQYWLKTVKFDIRNSTPSRVMWIVVADGESRDGWSGRVHDEWALNNAVWHSIQKVQNQKTVARPFVPCSRVGHSASSESTGASVRHK